MTEKERALLLTVAQWMLTLEGGLAADGGNANHPGLMRLRALIEAVKKGEDQAPAQPKS